MIESYTICFNARCEVGCQKRTQYIIPPTGWAPMPTRIRYTREFKEQAVNLILQDGLSQIETAERLSLSPKTLSYWIRTAKAGRTFAADKGTSGAEQKLERLRKENSVLRMECEILKKAAAYFAKESL